jgi:hypothetical protein
MVGKRHPESSVLFDGERPWQNFSMDYETSKARHDAAFDATTKLRGRMPSTRSVEERQALPICNASGRRSLFWKRLAERS